MLYLFLRHVLRAAVSRRGRTHFPPTLHQRSIRKLLNAPLKGEAMARWYPPELIHSVHGYQDHFVLRRQAQLSRLRWRGKGPPKKGQGKRSKKKK